ILRGERARRFDVEARVALGGLDELSVRERLTGALEKVRVPAEPLLRQLLARGALALGADLADQERHARVLRADGARLLGELLCAVQVMLLEQRLRFRHESLDDLLDTVQRARIARAAAQSLAVQIRGARARRCHNLTG